MKWVQRRRAVTVRRAGRLVLCMGTRSTFGEYGGCSSAAERARQVFGRSPCRPVRVRPSHITRAVLASRAPLGRRPSVALGRQCGRRDDSNRKSRPRRARQYFSKSGTPRAPRPLHSTHFSEHSPGCGAIFFTVWDLRRSGRFPPAKTAHLPLWRTEAPSTRVGYRTAGREPNLPEQRCRSRARGRGPCASRSQMGRVGLPGAPGRVS
jgi:hypothetical protein